MSYTRQGVRDLNNLPSKPAGRQCGTLPETIVCEHSAPRRPVGGNNVRCKCGTIFTSSGEMVD